MLADAKIPLAEQISNSPQTTHVQLNLGAFSKVIFDLFNYWNTFPPDQVLIVGETQVTLKEIRIDEEVNGKKVDALAKFLHNGKNISLFAYCTNQTIMVQGVSHKEFLASFLPPVLKKNFLDKKADIDNYNELVLKTLSSLKVNIDDSVLNTVTPDRSLKMKLRKRTSVICDNCGKEFSSARLFENHTESAHSNITRAKPRGPVRNS